MASLARRLKKELKNQDHWVPAAFFALLSIILWRTRGNYTRDPLIIMTLSWAACMAVVGAAQNRRWSVLASWNDLRLPLSIAAVYFAYGLAANQHIIYAKDLELLALLRILLAVGASATVGTIALAWKGASRRVYLGACLATGTIWVAGKIISLEVDPSPFIDVFTSNVEGIDYLADGLNPYAQTYTDIYAPYSTYPAGFAYWPGTLLMEALGQWTFGDLRSILIVCDLVVVGALWHAMGRLGTDERLRPLFPLLWLSLPFSLYTLEQAWVDPLLIAWGSIVFCMLLERRWLLAGLALGVFCSTKRYTIFFALLTGAHVLSRFGSKAALRLVAGAVASFAAIVLPFALTAWTDFYRMTVQVPLAQGMRKDSMSLIALAYNFLGISVSGTWMLLATLAGTAAALFWVLRRPQGALRGATEHADQGVGAWLGALVLNYGVVFLFGKQAYINYYHLVVFFMLLYLVWISRAPVIKYPHGTR